MSSRPEASLRRSAPQLKRSLLSKIVQTMLIVSTIIGASTVAIVGVTSTQSAAAELATVQGHIEDGITSKGTVLTRNHAIALRSLISDNAFLDIQRLVERTVTEDPDLVYGVCVDSRSTTLAFSLRDPRATTTPASLGLAALATVESTRREHVLDEDVVEVAVPIMGDDGIVGSVRYGLSTRRMYSAIARARAESRARLVRSLAMVGSLVVATSLLGLLLSRLNAGRITKPLRSLTEAANTIAAGRRHVRVEIASGDELEILGHSFNGMMEDLDSSYRELEEMNTTLEDRVQTRTFELAGRNRDMRLVLDNVAQGFLTLSASGVMAREQSRVVSEWFGPSAEEMTFASYLQPIAPGFAGMFELFWDQLVDGVLPVEACIAQLPGLLVIGPRTWHLEYQPFFEDGRIAGVLVVIAELSEQLAREREELEQREEAELLRGILSDKSGFLAYVSEASALVGLIASSDLGEESPALLRSVHTLKGASSSMGLLFLARLCHDLEDAFCGAPEDATTCADALSARWKVLARRVAELTERSGPPVLEVPEAEYRALIARLARDERHADVLAELASWQLETAQHALERVAGQAKVLARQLQKGSVAVHVQADEIRLEPAVWNAFFSELVHVMRNAVDHGLETPSEREELGKPAQGTMMLGAKVTASSVVIEVGDDGRGIDWETVALRARQCGLPSAEREDLVEALFSDGLSTRDAATATSGRGVGMAAFRQCVRAMGGTIAVQSTRGVGTTWTIDIPRAVSATAAPPRAPSGITRLSLAPALVSSRAR